MSPDTKASEKENKTSGKKSGNKNDKAKKQTESKKKTDSSSKKIAKLEHQILQLEEKMLTKENEVAGINDRYLRLAAEFDNYRKRTEREISDIREYAGEKVLREVLPIFDDINRALDNDDENEDSVREGLSLIQKKFGKMLSDFGVLPIEAVGQEFNPDYHHALMTREAEDVEPDMILEEFEKGYTYKEHVLRYSKVIVSK